MTRDGDFDSAYEAAMALKRNGDLQGARVALESLSRAFPKDVATLLMLGHVLWELGELDQAVKPLRKVVASRPKSEIASLALFHVLWGLSKRRAAVNEMGRFMSLGDSKDYRDMFTPEEIKEAIDSASVPL